MFFFFFYCGLENEPVVREAFRQICAEKLFSDLYCDMEEYLSARISKREMRSLLEKEGSVFADLYKGTYPTEDYAFQQWHRISMQYVKEQREEGQYEEGDRISPDRQPEEAPRLKKIEAKAIVNWIYRIYPKKEIRQEETRRILETLAAEYGIQELGFEDTIIYVKSKAEIRMITSFTRFCDTILGIENKKRAFYYRGHSDSSFLLQPSVMRKESWLVHERDMYNAIRIECPQDFSHCRSHLDFLVHM